VPDPQFMFLLQPQHSAWAHDTYGISVQNGLLSSVTSSNADQSGAVFLKLAELAGFITALTAPAVKAPQTNLPPRIEVMFDPDDVADANANARAQLAVGRLTSIWSKTPVFGSGARR
jgi:hypothetical protein